MQIRRIHQEEAGFVGSLWDRMCREADDDGPLTEQGLTNLTRMLAMAAWHRDAFCLVAVHDGRIVGYVNGRIEVGDGLLPGLAGELECLYVVPDQRGQGTSHALAEAAVGWLRDHGAQTIRYLSCADARDDHRFWERLGFQPDMVCLSLYAGD